MIDRKMLLQLTCTGQNNDRYGRAKIEKEIQRINLSEQRAIVSQDRFSFPPVFRLG
jgi:hypothetical protein